ncbi:hypothetical protein FACS1894130_09730 [Spirochaetia bacterium]|nr:hypothetical protein FACS1894130_09730 [Spirochaetia bacterium]
MLNFKWGGIAAGFGFILSLLIGLISGAGIFALARALVIGIVFFILGVGAYMVISRFLSELLEAIPGGKDNPGSRVDISVGGDDEPSADGEISDGRSAPQFAAGGGSPGGRDLGAEAVGLGLDHLDAFSDPEVPAEGSDVPFADGSSAKIQDLPVAALDQIDEERYTKKGSVEGDFVEVLQSNADLQSKSGVLDKPLPPLEGISEEVSAKETSMDALPDLDAMSQAFLAPVRTVEPGGEGTSTEGTYSLSVSGKGSAPYVGSKHAELEGDFKPKDIAQAIQTILKRD